MLSFEYLTINFVELSKNYIYGFGFVANRFLMLEIYANNGRTF